MAEILRAHGVSLGVGLALLVLAALGIRWIAGQRGEPPPRKTMQFTMVKVEQAPPPRPPPPPPAAPPPKAIEPEQTTRVEIKATEIPPPDAPPPSSAPQGAPAAGPLALAAEGDGPGDAFNLAGKPGGRGLLSGGGLGEGTGDGELGGGGGGAGARYGWYYGKIRNDIERALRSSKKLARASTRVEIRIAADASGHLSRVELLRSTGDPEQDEAIRSLLGLRVSQVPPGDVPMPFILRFTARRPQ
jgi:outer membrane biosynthesis protein TonB